MTNEPEPPKLIRFSVTRAELAALEKAAAQQRQEPAVYLKRLILEGTRQPPRRT